MFTAFLIGIVGIGLAISGVLIAALRELDR
jgi:hypothetical protein